MHEFLNAIADGYLRDPEATHYTFVFPNMRSRRYFAERLAAGGIDSRRASSMCLTLTRLVEEASGMKKTSTERLLYILYRAYCNVRARNGADSGTETFDRFRYWGRMLLSDFDDVDRALADPAEVFRNVEDYKEIQSFYLTPEQERIIRDYWGDDPYWSAALNGRKGVRTDDLPFWNHVNPGHEPDRKFTQLWAMLGDIYAEFRRLLDAGGECYPAMACRAVADRLAADPAALPFGPKRFVFIGFSRLTNAELVIFDRLKDRAHFYWDYDPALMDHCGPANCAGRLVGNYARRFTAQSPYVELPPCPAVHKVEVIGVPSASAQAKVAARRLTDANTALVLADESMLVPMLTSVPHDRYEKLNVTMGYPMRYSSLAQFYSLLTSMQLRLSYDAADVPVFFHDDVIALVSHPGLRSRMPRECAALVASMRRNGLYNLPANRLDPDSEALRPLFEPVGRDAGARETAAYVRSVLDFAAARGMLSSIDRECADVIKGMVEQITQCCEEFDIATDRRTFFETIDRTIMQRSLPLEGETFEAMQIMGVGETRSLGFDNVVMLSMSDDIYPGRDKARSFIPEALRRAYGLPTADVAEAEQAYQFYRILSRAHRLTLIYDARCGALRQGEPSRYITQLRFLNFPGVELTSSMVSFANPKAGRKALIQPGQTLAKTPELLEELHKFADPEHIDTHRLSASRLKGYLNCPLAFFLATVDGIDIPEPDKEEPGAAEHGSVVHEAAERIYGRFMAERDGDVEAADLQALIDGTDGGMLDRELERAMKIHLLHCAPDAVESTALGEKELMYKAVLRLQLESLFRRDMADAPFRILGVEASEVFSWQVKPGLTVNFRIIIDRIDRLKRPGGDIVRIIDYKTGADATEFSDMDSLFALGAPHRASAIFQLLLYCEAYLALHPEATAESLRPQIFKLKEIGDEAFGLLGMGSRRAKTYVEIDNYAQVAEAFREQLHAMFDRLFDPEVEIERAADDGCCKFCNFKALCH